MCEEKLEDVDDGEDLVAGVGFFGIDIMYVEGVFVAPHQQQ